MTNRVAILITVLVATSGCRAAAPEISTYSIQSVCFSPNGKYLATGGGTFDSGRYRFGQDGELKVWEAGTWKVRASARDGFTGKVDVVVFKSPSVVMAISHKNNRNLRGGGNPLFGTTGLGNPFLGIVLRFYDVGKQRELPPQPLKRAWYQQNAAIGYDLDHNLLAFNTGSSTCIYDAATLKKKVELEKRPLGQLRFAPDGKTLVCYGDGFLRGKQGKWSQKAHLRLYDVKTGKILAVAGEKYIKPTTYVSSHVNFSPDGKLLAVATKAKELHLMKSDLSAVVRTLKPGYRPEGFAFAADSKSIALTTGYDKCTIYDIKTGAAVRSFDGKSKEFYASCMAFSPDGSMLAVGCVGNPKALNQGLVQIWDVKTGKLVKELR